MLLEVMNDGIETIVYCSMIKFIGLWLAGRLEQMLIKVKILGFLCVLKHIHKLTSSNFSACWCKFQEKESETWRRICANIIGLVANSST